VELCAFRATPPPTFLLTFVCVQGSEFTVERLLGPEFADVAEQYAGGALMISRLAPQDYHRFHMAVSGRVARRASIDGALYTVNPVAIRQNINVYTENKRVVRGFAVCSPFCLEAAGRVKECECTLWLDRSTRS
jgi:phosphatidylserine decarboxylase